MSQQPKTWNPEIKSLIERFKKAPLPPLNVDLEPGVKIVNPKLWRECILSDIAAGPDGPRAKTGALQDELKAFFNTLGSSER